MILGVLLAYSEKVAESNGWLELEINFSEPDGGQGIFEVQARLTKEELDRYFTVMGLDEAYESGYRPGGWSVQNNGTVYRNPENWPSSKAESDPGGNIIEFGFDYENNGRHSSLSVFIVPSDIKIESFNPPIPEGMQTDGYNKFVLHRTGDGIHLRYIKAGWGENVDLDLTYKEANDNSFVRLVLTRFIIARRQLQLLLSERTH